MSLNIIDLIKGQLGPALVSQAATQYGESESGISKAISGLLPAVVGGLANKSNDSVILDALTGPSTSGLLGNLFGGSQQNSMINSVLSSIFGDKISGLINTIAGFAGIRNGSASSLLNLVTGATLGSVAKYAADQNLDRNGISSLLNDQKGIVSTLLPAGLSLASLGFGDKTPDPIVTEPVSPEVKVEEPRVTPVSEPKVEVHRAGSTHEPVSGGGSIWKWLLPLLLLLAIGYFLFKQCGNKETQSTAAMSDTVTVEEDTATLLGDTVAVTREATTVTLPNGTSLNAFRGGIEDQIVSFLNSGDYDRLSDEDLANRWFNFDNLNFEFGTTNLTPESQVQLDNLKAILAAYPNAKVKIGAYTDKKGDDEGNKRLSQSRADAVKNALASAQVTEAEGYGEEFATVDENASDEEREADRKTAIRFVK